MSLLLFLICGAEGGKRLINFSKQKVSILKLYRNNDELYSAKDTDAVIISTADFQHALLLG